MTSDPVALLTLLQITDTSFPSGAFAFSGGLETLVHEGRVRGAQPLHDFLTGEILPRWAHFDRVFLRAAFDAAPHTIPDIDADCETRNTIASLADASRRQGRATLSSHARLGTPGADAYLSRLRAGAVPGHAAVVQAIIGRGRDLPLAMAEMGALHALATATVSAAVRLGAIGALQGQQVLAACQPVMLALLAETPPDTPFTFAPRADIAAMRHSLNPTRLFAV